MSDADSATTGETNPSVPATSEQETPATPEQASGGLIGFVTTNPVIAVTLLGAFAYVVVRLGQTRFYSKFGLEPEDVGLTYTETLTRAAAAVLVLSILTALYTWALWWFRNRHSSTDTKQRRQRKELPVIGFVVLTLYLLGGWMLWAYSFTANDVKAGNALRPGGLTFGMITNPLGLRVEQVHVEWVDDGTNAYEFGDGKVMYLGRAGGVAVFYDQRKGHQRTVRVPDSAIVIERQD